MISHHLSRTGSRYDSTHRQPVPKRLNHHLGSAGYGKGGVADYCLCLNGAFWSIEVKRPGKDPTAIQTRRMNEVCAAGGHAVAGTAEVVIQTLRDWLAVRGIVA